MAKKLGGQLFESSSSSPMSGITIVIVVLLGVWIFYRAFLKKCDCSTLAPVAPVTKTTTAVPAATAGTDATAAKAAAPASPTSTADTKSK